MTKAIPGYPSSIQSNKRVRYYACGDGRSRKNIQSRMMVMSSHDKKSELAGEPTSMTMQGQRVEDDNRASFSIIVNIDAFNEQWCSVSVKVGKVWCTRLE
jgi:hypothetical protein